MSTTVDQKVVQMQFDNENFEKNVKQSMSTLDKLKSALHFGDSTKGIDELNKSIKKIDFSQAEIAATRAGFHIRDVWLKLSSVLEYNIARRIINFSERMAKSLTLDQITAGYDEYELKMGSVQTIMASTGESLEVVNGYLDELNHYADKTIYSFSDMTANIGKFTNAGVKLKDAVAAIQGVSNLAAVSGANANEASRAMYNFAQALSAGYVKLIDWKSIENANMATVEFKDTLLQTAEVLGNAKKNSEGYYEILSTNAKGKRFDGVVSATKNFNDSLAHQWMTTEVLTQTLELYSSDIREMTDAEKEQYEQRLKSKGYTEEQIKQLEELGIKAADAATQVKTFSQLMDTVKEAIGSGWAMTFENIIGNYDEAKELLTSISKYADTIIGEISDKRNRLFGNWKKLGGRDDIIKGLKDLVSYIEKVLAPVKDVFSELFPPMTSKKLASLSRQFREWAASLRFTKEDAESLRVTLHYLVTPIKILIELVKFAFSLIGPIVRILSPVLKIVITLSGALLKLAGTELVALTRTKAFRTAINSIRGAISAVIKGIGSLAKAIGTGFVNALKDSNSWLNKTIAVLKVLGSITLGALIGAFNSIKNFRFDNVVKTLTDIGNKLKKLGEESKVIKGISDAFNFMKDIFASIGDAFVAFYEKMADGFDQVESFSDFLSLLWDGIKAGKDALEEFIKSKFFTDGKSLLDTIKTTFSDFITVLRDGIGEIPWAKIILISFTLALGAAVLELVNAVNKFGGLAAALKESVFIINETIKTVTGLRNRLIMLKEIAIFIAAITFSLGIISQIDKQGNLVKSAVVLGSLAAGLMILAEAMLWINSKNAFKPVVLASLFKSLAVIAVGVGILALTTAALKELNLTLKETLPYLETLGVLMLGMLASVTILSLIGKDKKLFYAGSLTILSIASAVRLLASALGALADVKFTDINSLLKALLATFAGFAAVLAAASLLPKKWYTFLSVLALAASIRLLASTFSGLANLKLSDDAKGLLNMLQSLVVSLVSIAALVVIVKSLTKKTGVLMQQSTLNASSISVNLAMFAASFLMIAVGIKKIVEAADILNSKSGNVAHTIGAVIITLGLFAGLIVAIMAINKKLTMFDGMKMKTNSIIRVGLTMLLMTTALVPLSGVLSLLAQLVKENSVEQIMAAGTIMTALILAMGKFLDLAKALEKVNPMAIIGLIGGVSIVIGEVIALSMLMKDHGMDLLKSLGMIGLVFAGFVAAVNVIGKWGNTQNIDFKPILAMTVPLIAVVGSIIAVTKLLKDEGWSGVGKVIVSFGAVCIEMFATMWALGKWADKVDVKPILAMTVPFLAVVGSIIAVTKLLKGEGWSGVLKVLASFAGVCTIMIGTMAAINHFVKDVGDWASILAFTAIIAAVAGSLWLLADKDWKKLAIAAGIIAGFTTVMAGVLIGFSLLTNLLVDTGVGAIVPGVLLLIAGAIVSLTISMSIFVNSIAAFLEALTHVIEAIIKLGENGKQIGEGLKEAVPGVKEAIMEISQAIRDAAPTIAAAVAIIFTGIIAAISKGSIEIAKGIAEAAPYLSAAIQVVFVTLANTIGLCIYALIAGLLGHTIEFNDAGVDLANSFGGGLETKAEEILPQIGSWFIQLIVSSLVPGGSILWSIGSWLKDKFVSGATMTAADQQVIETSVENAVYGGYNSAYAEVKTASIAQKGASIPSAVNQEIAKEAQKGSKIAQQHVDSLGLVYSKGTAKTYRTIDEFAKAHNKSATTVGKTLDWLSDKTGIDMSKMSSYFGDMKDGAVNLFNTVTGGGKDTFGKLGDWLNDTTGGLFSEFNVVDKLTGAMEEAEEQTKAFGAATEEAGGKAKKSAKEVDKLAKNVEDYITKMHDSMDIFSEFDLGLDEENPITSQKLLDNIKSNIDGMKTWATELVSLGPKINSQLYAKLQELGPQGYKYVHAFTQMTEEELKTYNGYYAQYLVIPQVVTAQVYGGAYQAAANASTGFINGLNIGEIQTAGMNMALGFLTKLNEGLDINSPSKKTYATGVYALQGLSNGMKDASTMSILTSRITSLATKIITDLRTKLSVSTFKQIGEQIPRGLANGIGSGQSEVINAIQKLGTDSIGKAHSVFQVRSPSRIFFKIGSYLDAGLANGIADNISVVNKSMSKLSYSVINDFRDAMNVVADASSVDMDIQPVIRPVVDLTNVRTGAGSINDIMNSQVRTARALNYSNPANYITQAELVSNNDNSDVVTAIGSLKDDISNLKDAMTNIKMVLDTGTMVGAMTPQIDQQLGNRRVLAGRGI